MIWTICVGTVNIGITNMTIAFINICEHNRFVKCNWLGKKTLASLSHNKAIIIIIITIIIIIIT